MIRMSKKQNDNDDLEEELEEAFRRSEKKTNVFKIIRNETSALDMKEKRMKAKLKSSKKAEE